MRAEFYKMDFRAWNIGTVDLTLEQEAAYLRLCHAIYDAHGPVPNSIRLLCSIFRCGNIKAAALLRVLIERGKIQITSDGLLTNRRALAELAERTQLSAKRSDAGEHGGRAGQRRGHRGSESAVTAEWVPIAVPVSAECSPTDAGVGAANSLKPNDGGQANASPSGSREEERKEDTPTIPKGTEPDRFPEFKAAYPKRSTIFPTTLARKRWNEALRRGANSASIIAGARAYATEQARIGKVGTEFVKTADVWLNQGRWADHAPAAEPSASSAAPVPPATWRDRVQTWRDRGGYWPWNSPAPDEPGTVVPADVLAEFAVIGSRAA